MIDISKIKPGDKVTLVPLEVVDKTKSTVNIIFKDECHWISADQIAAHHPAPREFQVGDRVRSGGSEGAIEHLARGRARVLWDSGYDLICSIEDLTLVEAGQ